MDILIYLAYLAGIIISIVIQQYPVNRLEDAMVALSLKFKLSTMVAGATLIAIASSAPEFGTAFAGVTVEHKFDIGFSVIMWSAIFNILVITGASSIASKEKIKISDYLFNRDLLAYIIVLIAFLFFCLDEVITWKENSILIVLYLAYIVALWHTNGTDLLNGVTYRKRKILFNATIGIIGVFISSAMLVRFGVLSLYKLGDLLGMAIPISVIACTFWGPGTSIVDLMMSINLSKRGHGESGVVNGIASNTFDIAICLGFNGLLYNLLFGDIHLNITSGYFLVSLVIVSLVVMTLMLYRKRELTVSMGYALIGLFVFMFALQIFVAFRFGL